MKITVMPESKTSKIKTVSDLRRLLARTLSSLPGEFRVTDFNFSISIRKPGE